MATIVDTFSSSDPTYDDWQPRMFTQNYSWSMCTNPWPSSTQESYVPHVSTLPSSLPNWHHGDNTSWMYRWSDMLECYRPTETPFTTTPFSVPSQPAFQPSPQYIHNTPDYFIADSQLEAQDSRYTFKKPALSITTIHDFHSLDMNTLALHSPSINGGTCPSLLASPISDDTQSSSDPFPHDHTDHDRRLAHPTKRTRRTFAPQEPSEYWCKKCSKPFRRSYNLKAHMATHEAHRSLEHVCHYAECARAFSRRADLERHVNSVHIREKAYLCPQCGKSFTRKDTQRRHVDDGCPRRGINVLDRKSSGGTLRSVTFEGSG